VLAVQVDYERRRAIIGTDRNRPVPREAIIQSLESIGYNGEFMD
jgi:hypothetical protein